MLTLPLSRPDISELELQYVCEVLKSGRLALGPRLEAFEESMSKCCGTRHAIAVSSGTAALHLSVQGLGIGSGDEVITTPFSFIASSNVLLYEEARPRFVDISPDTLNLDPDAASRAITSSTKAILAVDIFGMPVDWPALSQIASKHNLRLIDDACHALGARIGGEPIGSWADAATFGFYPNKQVTTGEGGCITTNSDELATLCRSLRNQGRAVDGRMEHIRLGYNYRMSELSAALGCAQMERLPELLQQRALLAAGYNEALAPLQEELIVPTNPIDGERSWFVYVVRLADHYSPEARNILMKQLHEAGIASAPYFPSIHLQPYYRRRFGFKPGDFPKCEAISARTLALPFYTTMAREDISYVAATIERLLPGLPTCSTSVFLDLPEVRPS